MSTATSELQDNESGRQQTLRGDRRPADQSSSTDVISSGSPVAILIVDDEIQDRKLLETLLKPEGYLTRSAASGEEALASVAQRAPDLILLDIMMPDMDGFQVATSLKANPATSHIPIIMVTAIEGRDARMQGLKAGAEEFLTKPVDRGELWLRVRNLLRLKSLGDLQKNQNAILDQLIRTRTAELHRFRAAMEISGDAIVLVDRASMRYIDVNQTLCDMVGRTRQEVIGMTPMQLFSSDRETLERDYDAIIADPRAGAGQMEGRYCHKDGTQIPIETRRRALHTDNGWIIVCTATDITGRKAAEEKIRRLNRVYAMLSGINSAIVRIHKRDELFKETCRIAVEDGDFLLARVVMIDAGGKAGVAATSESAPAYFQGIVDSYNGNPAQSKSLLAHALRDRQPIISNDVAGDLRIPNRVELTKAGNYGLVLLPIIVEQRIAGTIVLRTRKAGMIDESELSLLLELTANVALALDRIEKEEQLVRLDAARKRDEEALLRFSSAMDATADAIYLVDRESMRFTHVNDAACRMQGMTRDAIMELGPEGVLSIPRDELARTYDAIIAGGVEAAPLELPRRRLDGSEVWVEIRRHAQFSDHRWTIVTLVRDVTERRRTAQKLIDSEARFRSLSELSSDWFWEQDAEHRFVEFSGGDNVKGWGTDQRIAIGMRRWELPTIVPLDGNWAAHKAALDAHEPFRNLEYRRYLADGSLQYVTASGEPLFDANGRFTGYRGVATEITQRKEAEVRIRRLNRVHAVLSGINTLIVRVRDRGELFREACRIAVEAGGFKMAWIGIIDQKTLDGTVVAWHGGEESFLDMIRLTAREGTPSSDRPGSRAVRLMQPVISNDFAMDPSVHPIRDELLKRGHRSAACFPLSLAGRCEGVLSLYSGEINVFDDEETRLLMELADDISLALEHIDKAQKLARMTRVNAMLSGINAAIVRIRGRQALFEEACRIAVQSGGLAFAWLCVVDQAGERLRPVASAGPDNGFLELIRGRFSLRDDAPEGHGIGARCVREGRPLVVNDIQAANLRYKKAHAERGIKSAAALPLFVAGRIVGVLGLHAGEIGFFDENEMKLLTEVAANIAFALEHIEKEEKVRRLTRVYAVLSGINSLIVRTSDRDELFRETCRVAVEIGQFAKAWLGSVDPASKQFTMIAAHGGDPLFFESLARELSGKIREGSGLVVRAIETGQPVIVNDAANDLEVLLKSEVTGSGVRSLAILPLIVAGEVVAVFALNADVVDYFDDEEMKLLVELAGNIAFAIDHIGRQDQLDYLAYYDVLTGLANRRLFLERVAQYMRSAASGGHKLAVFLVDLERFKNINDSLGQSAGDALLKQVADWLTRNTGDASLVARIGADHFAVVLPEVRQDSGVASLAEKTLAAFMAQPFRLEDAVLRVAAKVGVALYPDDGADADGLLKNAEAALKNAKASGDKILFYTHKMTEKVAGTLTLENKLRRALDHGEFVLHYQPKVTLADGKVTGAEALIRWNDPQTGLVPPGRFIPVLEETGLIYQVGRWALGEAIAEYLRWRDAGLAAVRIAVNISPMQLRNRGFVGEINQVLGIHPAAASGLELEITESLIMEDVKRSVDSLRAIRAMGVPIAIDDFGTGFSSLSHLARLPVDTLKIDRSFVVDMTQGPDGLALVSTIINLAHSLKLKVVAEGVETEEQSRLLRLLNCDEMQGFLFCKPVPAEMFVKNFLAPPAAVGNALATNPRFMRGPV